MLMVLAGPKTYCCKEIWPLFVPPAFTQCTWAIDIRLMGDKACQAACPANHLRLAVQFGECAVRGGMEALCCQGTVPSTPPNCENPDSNPSDLPHKKLDTLLDFELALDRYTHLMLGVL
jgi:hypothetical protein